MPKAPATPTAAKAQKSRLVLQREAAQRTLRSIGSVEKKLTAAREAFAEISGEGETGAQLAAISTQMGTYSAVLAAARADATIALAATFGAERTRTPKASV